MELYDVVERNRTKSKSNGRKTEEETKNDMRKREKIGNGKFSEAPRALECSVKNITKNQRVPPLGSIRFSNV